MRQTQRIGHIIGKIRKRKNPSVLINQYFSFFLVKNLIVCFVVLITMMMMMMKHRREKINREKFI
jgi:hypothetical protein